MRVFAHDDPYLATYLQEQGYDEEQVEFYRWNSRRVNRSFGRLFFIIGCGMDALDAASAEGKCRTEFSSSGS